MRKMAAVVLVLGVASVVPASADEAPVYLGSRVRIRTPQGSLVGNLMTWEGDHVSVINTGLSEGPYVIKRDAIQTLELSRGRKRPWLKSGLIGAAIGGVIGALMPVENACPEGVQPGPTCETKAYFVQSGAMSGAVIGLIAGASRQVDKWETVPATRFRVAIAPVPGGAAAAVSITR